MTRIVLLLAAGLTAGGCRDSGAPVPEAGLIDVDSLARYPTIAMTGTDTALVAWASSAGGATNVYLARMVAGVAADPVRVNDRPGDAATHAQAPAQVAVAPDGKVYVAWISQQDVPGRRFPASDLRLARSVDGGRTFAPAVTVNDDGGFRSGHHFHDLGIAPDGVVYVSWLDSRVKDAYRDSSASSTEPAHDGHESHDHERHSAGDEPGTEVRVARSSDGGRTFTDAVVATGACECCRTRLAFGADGVVFVAWRHQFRPDVRDPAVARSDDGGLTFSAPVRVSEDDWTISGCPHSGPAIAVDQAGRVHLAWHTGAEGRAGLYHAVSTDGGGTFSDPTLIADARGASPSLASRASGAWLAWEEPSGAVRVASLTASGAIVVRRRRTGASPALAPGAIVRVDDGRIMASALP